MHVYICNQLDREIHDDDSYHIYYSHICTNMNKLLIIYVMIIRRQYRIYIMYLASYVPINQSSTYLLHSKIPGYGGAKSYGAPLHF